VTGSVVTHRVARTVLKVGENGRQLCEAHVARFPGMSAL